MKVFMTYVWKSMTESKKRFFQLIAAITISTALFTISFEISEVMQNALVTPKTESYENKEILIHSADINSVFFSNKGLNPIGIKEDSIIKELCITGQYVQENNTQEQIIQKVNVRGRAMEDINTTTILMGNLKDFEGEACIISNKIADRYHLKTGDHLQVIIGSSVKNLKVVALCSNTGAFINDNTASFTIFIPYHYLSTEFGEEGNYNLLLADSSESSIEEGIRMFNESNSNFTAEKVINEETKNNPFTLYIVSLFFLLLIAIITSGYVIYNLFKYNIKNQISNIHNSLIQGSTIVKVKLAFYLQGFLYSFIGAFFGNLLGSVGLCLIHWLVSPLKGFGVYGTIRLDSLYLIAGTAFAFVFFLLLTYLPIQRISTLQISGLTCKTETKKSSDRISGFNRVIHNTGRNVGLQPKYNDGCWGLLYKYMTYVSNIEQL